jgi:hypothetical protein
VLELQLRFFALGNIKCSVLLHECVVFGAESNISRTLRTRAAGE